MTPGARVAAAITILDSILAGAPAEQALTGWARASRFAGSGDRAAVRDHVFDVLRAKRSLAAHGGAMTGRALMAALLGDDAVALFNGAGHAPAPLTDAEVAALTRPPTLSPAEAHDLADWLWLVWQDSLSDEASDAAHALQTRADVFLRVNLRRCTVAEAVAALAADDISAVPHDIVQGCLRVTGNARRIKNAAAYLDGRVELQDAASQFAAMEVPLPKTGRLLDYCAGGGGKALALADRFDGKVFAHDIARGRMKDIPARAARAGVAITILDTPSIVDAGPFDVVFCDAPCSGSGTWRRSPDAKWQITQDMLDHYAATQAEVIAAAAAFVADGGVLAYATCSVLRPENDSIVEAFIATHSDWRIVNRHQLLPCADWDGFYLCCLRKIGATKD